MVGNDSRCVIFKNGIFTDHSEEFEIYWSEFNEKPDLNSVTWDDMNNRFLILSDVRDLMSYREGEFIDISNEFSVEQGSCRKITWMPGGDRSLILLTNQGDLEFEIVTYK